MVKMLNVEFTLLTAARFETCLPFRLHDIYLNNQFVNFVLNIIEVAKLNLLFVKEMGRPLLQLPEQTLYSNDYRIYR